MKYALFSPTGRRILGTAESMLCTASILVRGRNPDGSLDWEHDGEESTDHYETMETRTDENGETLFTDDEGRDWPESKLKLRETK